MLFVAFLLASAGVTWARPNESIDTRNIVTVPPNCPPGQELINGICRDVWRQNNILPANKIYVPPNCLPGQQLINGLCCDVWRNNQNKHYIAMIANYDNLDTHNVITVPPNCKPGQHLVNGQCRDIWRNLVNVPPNCRPGQQFINGRCREVWLKEKGKYNQANYDNLDTHNVITVPPNCRPGQQLVNGQCRDIWRSGGIFPANVVTVPPNCPQGQEFINGMCRDVWLKNELKSIQVSNRMKEIFNKLVSFGKGENVNLHADDDNDLLQKISQNIDVANKNIINVPNQCPAGFKPDALGICREIFG